jgi:DNA modification methylase
VARPGDLWLLGNHRLLVGDATKPEDAALLMDGEQAQLILTDPPYNVNYHHSARARRDSRVNGHREKEHDIIEQDDTSPEDFQDFLDAAMVVYEQHLATGGSMYCFMALMRHTAFECALEGAGFHLRCHIVWAKNHFVLTFNRYKQQHEMILYCHRRGEVDAWYGDCSQSTVWLEKKPQASREHPTMKPVELLERALVNSTRRGDVVIDFFGGSGSTMIACERLGRKARLMEKEPVYADVILKRWANFTKRQPIYGPSGSTFLQIERERLLRAEPADCHSPQAGCAATACGSGQPLVSPAPGQWQSNAGDPEAEPVMQE